MVSVRSRESLSDALQQPTAFDLELFDSNALLQSRQLSDSLLGYLNSRKATLDRSVKLGRDRAAGLDAGISSKSLLRISATADYYTKDHSLMTDGLLVDIEISRVILK